MDLPRDITIEIFSRLPVKSLMRFKCVSTSFYNFISNDPLFRKKHLYHQSSFKKVILVPHHHSTTLGRYNVFTCPIVSLSPERGVCEDTTDLELRDRKSDFIDGIRFHNSCDGLLCMSMSGGDVVIWNPTTRQVDRFHSCVYNYIPKLRWFGYSLAHDPRANVYKLLGLTIYSHNTYRLYLYSMEMEMWRYIEESSACDYVKYDGNTTIVNGAFHWLGSSDEHFRMSHVVVTMDISDETYGTLALPQAICHNSTAPLLFEFKGKLCIFTQHASNPCRDLWVMNEYGDVDSMMKMFCISFVDVPRFNYPIHMLEDDTLVTYRPKQIYYYKDGSVSCITSAGGCNMNPYVYFESFISPHTCLQAVVQNRFPSTRGRVKNSHEKAPEKARQRLGSSNNLNSHEKALKDARRRLGSGNNSHARQRIGSANNFSATTSSGNSTNKATENVCQRFHSAYRAKHLSDTVPESFRSSVIANNFSTTNCHDQHSYSTKPENAFNSKLVANNIFATTSRGKHVVAKKRWQKSCLQQLCFCISSE
ncbi:hypothetical protein CASFOL_003530 [Castilleja foliolosa]|uniref:F-box domain-containing protein n=1 Tax=Castilleja foliolosa TaxID=1961234 RepID=A0ABD3EHW4_9LAMI